MSNHPTRRLSLDETEVLFPDHDYPSTWDSLVEGWEIEPTDKVFTLEAVSIDDINPSQLADDPDDDVGEAKIESLRQSVRSGTFMPPVYVVHDPAREHPYSLIEGRHRFNAHQRAGRGAIVAWVAHLSQ